MKILFAILLAVGLAGCAASGHGSPRDSAHETRLSVDAGRPAQAVAEVPATRPTGTDRLPPSSLEDYLSRLERDGSWSQANVDDVLLARTQFMKLLDRIPPEFSGYGASTVEGKLYTTTNDSVEEVLTWLGQNNPPGRSGFFTWVNAAGEHPRDQGTARLSAIGLEPYLAGRLREGSMDQRQVDDVLLARRKFMEQLDRIPPDFSGWAASTIDGKLHTTTESMAAAMEWIDQNTPPGRWGFFTWVRKVRSGTSTQPLTQPGTGTAAPGDDLGPSTSRAAPTNK